MLNVEIRRILLLVLNNKTKDTVSITAYTIKSINLQPLARNSSQYLNIHNHNFYPLISGSHEDLWSSGFPNYDTVLQLWQYRRRKYRKVVTRASNDNHDQSRIWSVSSIYPQAAMHCCIRVCCSQACCSLRGMITFDRILWETMEWMAIISTMNVHPSLGMFSLLHLYPLHLELSL